MQLSDCLLHFFRPEAQMGFNLGGFWQGLRPLLQGVAVPLLNSSFPCIFLGSASRNMGFNQGGIINPKSPLLVLYRCLCWYYGLPWLRSRTIAMEVHCGRTNYSSSHLSNPDSRHIFKMRDCSDARGALHIVISIPLSPYNPDVLWFPFSSPLLQFWVPPPPPGLTSA